MVNILQSIQMNSSRLNMYEMYKDSRLLYATKSIENLYEDKEGNNFYYTINSLVKMDYHFIYYY